MSVTETMYKNLFTLKKSAKSFAQKKNLETAPFLMQAKSNTITSCQITYLFSFQLDFFGSLEDESNPICTESMHAICARDIVFGLAREVNSKKNPCRKYLPCTSKGYVLNQYETDMHVTSNKTVYGYVNDNFKKYVKK